MTRPEAADARLGFDEVVGQDDAKLALLLATVEPRLGGVLLRGHKGSAKTTLARGLAALLPEGAPFVELPLGATEDRVLGSMDAAHLLSTGEARVRPGLLAAADGGVLYVDEINLLADHLVDALLDAAVSGVGRLERDGISHTFPARFVLVASMNPEEGELRPQLLDRFGLAVSIEAPTEVADRALAVRRQLARERGTDDAGDVATASTWHVGAAPAEVPDEIVELACRVALEVGAEGLRADLMLCRAAGARAGGEERPVDAADLRRVAPMVLGHRRRRGPFDEPGISDAELDDAFDRATSEATTGDQPPPPDGGDGAEPEPAPAEPGPDASAAADPAPPEPAPEDPPADPPADAPAPRGEAPADDVVVRAARADATRPWSFDPPRRPVDDERGRFVRAVPRSDEGGGLVAVIPTAIAAASRRAGDPTGDPTRDPGATVVDDDLRTAVHQRTKGRLVVIAVDASTSMGAEARIAATKGAVLRLLADAYQRRDRVALVAFRGERAQVVLRPTGSVEVARARLDDLAVGGATPLADALDTVHQLVRSTRRTADLDPVVVLLTDGRATAGGADPLREALDAAGRLAVLGAAALVVDTETGIPRLGLAGELAAALGARCMPLDEISDLAATIKTL